MIQLIFTDDEYKSLIGSIELFKEIDGDEEKPLELEDFYGLADMGRSMIHQIEKAKQSITND
ncbi:MAG: hypothetical protein QM541_03625 [Flavobacterium sp.]|nr:hypothetical protein [Flavobacterium sp.]